MARLTKTFQAGKMNKDLDERLLPQGQYRDAMNIEVTTSDGSDVGVVQSIRGNKKLPSYNEVSDPVAATVNHNGVTSKVVGSVSDDKTNSCYFFIASPEFGFRPMGEEPKVFKDMIVKYDSVSKKIHPVLTDILRYETPNVFLIEEGQGFDFISFNDENKENIKDNIRPGMVAKAFDAVTSTTFDFNFALDYPTSQEMGNGLVVIEVDEYANRIYFDRVIPNTPAEDSSSITNDKISHWIFTHPEPVLQFQEFLSSNETAYVQGFESRIENKQITGINIVDNLLLWTDGLSEPKKVNIDRLTNGLGKNIPRFSTHSKNLARDPYSDNPKQLKTLSQIEDPGNYLGLGVIDTITRDHITVIKKAPRNAVKLIMSNSSTSIDGTATTANCTHDFVNVYPGSEAQGVAISENFVEGSELVFTAMNNAYASVRASVTSVNNNVYTLDVHSVNNNITYSQVGEYVSWHVSLIQTDPMFSDKIGRFSYRYKYYDNECSTFAPWSELAFLPSKYDYTPIKGYNLGMTNNLRKLRVVDFVNEYVSRPDDVKEIDILFKDTTSPNVYVVKTIKRGKDFEWHNMLGTSTGFDGSGAKGVLDITTEMIHRTLESSQILRAWDNVPITAKAQEVTGNRLVYANYEQGYDVINDIVVDSQVITTHHPGIDNEDLSLSPFKSLKSMRKYKLGVVFGDKYGRETPVIGVGGSYNEEFEVDPETLEPNSSSENYVHESFTVKKDKCARLNKIKAKLKWGGGNSNAEPEPWMDYYKFYIKETSNEYYNLVMDRWYNNDDGTIWISFSSADRNKVDEDTYLILKKAHDSQTPVLNDDAKYKVLSISNEAPDYIKKVDKIIGVTPLDMTANVNLSELLSAQIVGESWLGSGIGAIASGARSFEGVGWARIKGVSAGATPSEVLYSEWRRVSNINAQSYSVSVTEPWGLRADMETDYGFGDGASVDYFVEVKDSVIENKPEFDGKFFVKIHKDSTLEQQVTIQSGSDITYSAELIADVGYIYTGGNFGFLQNPADQGAIYRGDYSTIATPVPNNGVNDYTDYSWGYTGFSEPLNNSETGVPGMYAQAHYGCDLITSSNTNMYQYGLIRDYWEDYWTGSTYGVDTANRWFIDHAGFTKPNFQDPSAEWEHAYNQGIFHTNIEEIGTLIVLTAFAGVLNSNFQIDLGASGNIAAGIIPQNKNTIMFSHVGTGYGTPDAEFKQKMTTIGQRFRFKADPGMQGDPIIYEVWAVIHNNTRSSYKGVGTFNGTPEGVGPYCQGCQEEGTVGSSWACKRKSFVIFFKQTNNDYQGLDTSVWDPRSAVKHDGSSSLKIELVSAADTSQYITTVNNIDNAIFETEPKEDVGLDLYYEASDAIPLNLNTSTIESYIPLFSKVKAIQSPSNTANMYAGHSYNKVPADGMNVSSIARDVVGIGDGGIEAIPIPLRLGDKLEFERPDGTINCAYITDYWQPIRKSSNSNTNKSRYEKSTVYEDVEFHLTAGPQEERKLIIPLTTLGGVDQSRIVGDIDLGFNPDSNVNYIWKLEGPAAISLMGLPSDSHFITGKDNNINSVSFNGIALFSNWVLPESIVIHNNTLDENGNLTPFSSFFLTSESSSAQVFKAKITRITGYYRLDDKVYDTTTVLPWFNCYSFGNGLESNRIKDDYNAPFINNGFKVSTTLDSYGKEFRSNGLIHSGIYNSTSGVNMLNQFNMAEPITKDVNPSYGPIQVLKSRDTNLVTFCEDKVLQILANKDALFNADGSSNLVSTNTVLGNTKAFVGDYGISNNPESLAVDGYRMYFVDKHRNKVLRLSQDGLTVISDLGMKSWFRDNLLNSTTILGTFDTVKGNYNISNYRNNWTVSFNERNKGWTSFKSFVADNGLSINADYLTSKDGDLYLHHVINNGDGPASGEFYDEKQNASVTMIFNDQPSIIKSFKAISYEGTQARVKEFVTNIAVDVNGNFISSDGLNNEVSDGNYYNLGNKNGWFVDLMETDVEEIEVIDFQNKEGKWFTNIVGKPSVNEDELDLSGLPTSNFSIQGIGIASSIESSPIPGCMSPCASNYNPLATTDNGSCVDNNVYDCMDPLYQNYNPNATIDQTSCEDVTSKCSDLHVLGCNVALNLAGTRADGVSQYTFTTAINDNPLVTKDNGDCIEQIDGCTNPWSSNYNASANFDDGTCVEVIYGCKDPDASNYNPDAQHNAVNVNANGDLYGNPCVFVGCMLENSTNYIGIQEDGTYLSWDSFTSSKIVQHFSSASNQYVDWPAFYKPCDYAVGVEYDSGEVQFLDEADHSCCDLIVEGCMDPTAVNYNPGANVDDGTCSYSGPTNIFIDEI